jgi:peptide/nickel transport system substrate-binding protein
MERAGEVPSVIRSKRSLIAVSLFAVLAIVLAACGSDSDSKGSGDTTTTAASSGGSVPNGGTLVVGAEQEPDCADWIASCAGASWGLYTIQEHTMPRTFDFEKKNGVWTEVPSILLTGEPTVTEVAGKQTVTYKINPKAVWSDGEPITSTDFKYSWNQVATGDDIYDKTGYSVISGVDDSDPKTAVVTFSTPFAGWKQLFGAFYGVMPSHILQGQDRSAAMANGYDWSGGPWIAKWDKGVQVTLTPNPNWYGPKAHLDKVIFKFEADTSAEFKAFSNGETMAIYPQPQLDAVSQIQAGIPGANSFYTADTGNVEALWINNKKAPFTSKAVRQAFAYSIDRNAIVKKLFGALGVDKAVNTINPPILSAYADPEAWAGYGLNLKKVDSLMKGDGWAKGSDGIWAKGGEKATFQINTTTGNKRRELTEQIVQEQLKKAGFDMTIENQEAGDLFGSTLPDGNYTLSLYAQTATSLQPGLCTIFCATNIPSAANGNSGQNWQRVDTPANEPLLTVDTDLNDAARKSAASKADKILAENQVSLPLDPLPNILLWSKKIVGPVHDDPILGMFGNINEWGLKK